MVVATNGRRIGPQPFNRPFAHQDPRAKLTIGDGLKFVEAGRNSLNFLTLRCCYAYR